MAAAAEQQQFPPQSQAEQPGKQHLMDPVPQTLNPDYKPANKLHGKVALVTGGDSGIGRAVCYLFALEGATVAFTYVPGQEEKDAKDTLKKIQELKSHDAKDPIALPADVGFDENCKLVVDEVVSSFGHIDILVNNAAEQHLAQTVEEIDENRLERIFRTNIFSHFCRAFLTPITFNCNSLTFTFARHALKHMNEGSTIINSTSVEAYCGSPTLLDYCATKGAIVSFTRGLALQLVGKGIRVNAVAPGPVWTPLQVASMPGEMVAKIGEETPMGRAAQPHEIAPSYVFLASEESSYFTGQVLHPNGLWGDSECLICAIKWDGDDVGKKDLKV
ncbi:Glucose and ribitol dehydrogenase [Orobanche minor]